MDRIAIIKTTDKYHQQQGLNIDILNRFLSVNAYTRISILHYTYESNTLNRYSFNNLIELRDWLLTKINGENLILLYAHRDLTLEERQSMSREPFELDISIYKPAYGLLLSYDYNKDINTIKELSNIVEIERYLKSLSTHLFMLVTPRLEIMIYKSGIPIGIFTHPNNTYQIIGTVNNANYFTPISFGSNSFAVLKYARNNQLYELLGFGYTDQDQYSNLTLEGFLTPSPIVSNPKIAILADGSINSLAAPISLINSLASYTNNSFDEIAFIFVDYDQPYADEMYKCVEEQARFISERYSIYNIITSVKRISGFEYDPFTEKFPLIAMINHIAPYCVESHYHYLVTCQDAISSLRSLDKSIEAMLNVNQLYSTLVRDNYRLSVIAPLIFTTPVDIIKRLLQSGIDYKKYSCNCSKPLVYFKEQDELRHKLIIKQCKKCEKCLEFEKYEDLAKDELSIKSNKRKAI